MKLKTTIYVSSMGGWVDRLACEDCGKDHLFCPCGFMMFFSIAFCSRPSGWLKMQRERGAERDYRSETTFNVVWPSYKRKK